MRKYILNLGLALLVTATAVSCGSTAKQETLTVKKLEQQAKRSGKAMLIIATDDSTTTDQIASATKIGEELQLSKELTIKTVNISQEANKALSAAWRLENAPLPVFLLISKRGNFMGGIPLQYANQTRLEALIPSPGFDQVMASINKKQAAIISIGTKDTPDYQANINKCTKIAKQLGNQANMISVDSANPTEASFLTKLGLSGQNEGKIVIINTSGQVAGVFNTATPVAQLVQAATAVQSGCGTGCDG